MGQNCTGKHETPQGGVLGHILGMRLRTQEWGGGECRGTCWARAQRKVESKVGRAPFQRVEFYTFLFVDASLCRQGWGLGLPAPTFIKAVRLLSGKALWLQSNCKSCSTAMALGGPAQMAVLCGLMEGFPASQEWAWKPRALRITAPSA